MRSFFSRLSGILFLVVMVLSVTAYAKPVQAQIFENPFRGMDAGEAAYTTGGFLLRASPAGYLWDRINGQDTIIDDVDYRQRTSAEESWSGGYRTTSRETHAQAGERILRDAAGLPPAGSGSITDQLTARLVGFIAFLMGVVVSFLGKVILLLINILLGFLSYNGFSTAPPVVIGWKMVRDLVNMFYIVILIISSYATILGWRSNELHVRTVLPKVILSAVLVNFSKTIVSLLIDASQIVMLTFVNAFSAIGAGNFTNAFHLPLITSANYSSQLQSLTSATSSPAAAAVATNGAGQVIIDVLLAAALQIFLLTIAIGVILMMVVFVAARIVGLWMLLVFSPIPFLASSLPSTISGKILGKKANQFWDQLSALLTGGPIMAFWLWLTFATLSAQGADERLGLFQGAQATDPGSVFGVAQDASSMFLSAIGNAQGLGSYVIAIAMMLMGLEAAMDVAGQVGGPAGGLMKSIGNKSRDYAQRAAIFAGGGAALVGAGYALRGAPTVAKGGAKLAGRAAGGLAGAAKFGFDMADRRFDVRRKMATAARKLPFAGQSEWLRKQQLQGREEQEKRKSEYLKILNNPALSDEEKAAEIRTLQNKALLNGDKAIGEAIEAARVGDLTKKGMNEKEHEEALKPWKDANKDAVKRMTGDDVVAKRVSDRAGKAESNRRRLADLEAAKALITGDSKDAKEQRQKLDDAMKKIRKENPHLIDTSTEEGAKEYTKQMNEARQNFNSLDDDAKSNFDVMRNMAQPGAFEMKDGKVVVGDATAIKNTRKMLQGKARDNFDAMVKFMKENEGVDYDKIRNFSIEQDSLGNSRVFEMSRMYGAAGGETLSGVFAVSKQRQEAVKPLEADYRANNVDSWTQENSVTGRPTVDATHAPQVINSAKTVGVSQVVQSVAKGSTGEEADRARQAVVNTVASHTGDSIGRTNSYLNQKEKYTDSTGATVERTYGEILRDQKAPAAMRGRIESGYQASLSEVLPVLDGVDELNQAQQIEFMSKMGESGVGQALDTRMMNDSSQVAAVAKVKAMVNENASAVNEWFRQQNATPEAQAEMQVMQEYRETRAMSEDNSKWFSQQTATPEGKNQIAEFEKVRTSSEDERKAYFESDAGKKKEDDYKQYVKRTEDRDALANRSTAVGAKAAAIDDFNRKNAEFTKYANAQAAIDQFKRNPGNNSSRERQRGGGGRTNNRRNRGGGGGPPAPKT